MSVPIRHQLAVAEPASQAIEDLYRAHGLALVRFALLLVGDQPTADDVVQDAFLGLHRNWRRGNDPANLPAYLRTAVLNAARSAVRARIRRQALTLRAVRHDPPAWSAEAVVMAGQDSPALLAAVARLPRRQREVLGLRYFLELSEKEIAEAMGITRGTVASTTARALKALARQLKEEQ